MVENVPNADLHMCSSPIRDEVGEHVSRMGENDI